MNIWKEATRKNLTITTERGVVSFTQLWKLPVSSNAGLSLDYLFKYSNKKLNESEISLLDTQHNPEKEYWELVKALVEDVYMTLKKEAEKEAERKALEEEYLKIKEVLKIKEEKALTKAKKEELIKKLKEIEKKLLSFN